MGRILVREGARAAAGPRGAGGRTTRLWTALLVALWAALALPLALGERTLVQRDVFATHLGYKWLGAAELGEGRVPALQPGWGLGQPYRGNPNALPWYPGNLLYLALPFWSAFGLHYVLHLLLAGAGMRRLARELGQSEPAALLAALAYAGSGWVATCLSFYNLLAVAAWTPFALAGLVRGGRRGALLAGVAGGLALLGGEPITAALAAPLALGVAVARHGARRGLALAGVAAALAAAIALPQLVSTLELLPHAARMVRGIPLAQVTTNELAPWRLLELVLPLPWGAISLSPPWSWWATGVSPWPPYVLALHFGVVALALALAALRRRPGWAAVALGALAAGWLVGLSPEATSRATLGLFRYPQKLLFPFTIAAALLAGWGLEAALERTRPSPLARALGIVAVALVALAAGLLLHPGALAVRLGEAFAPHAGPIVLGAQSVAWIAQIAAAGLLAGGAAWAIARRSAGGLLAAQLAGTAWIALLAPTDATAAYRTPPEWAGRIENRRVVSVPFVFPPWESRPGYERTAFPAGARQRLDRELLEPSHAVVAGLESPLAPDPDGLAEPMQVALGEALAGADWDARVRWLRRLGVGALVRDAPGRGPALERLDRRERHGAAAELLRVPAPRERVFRPRAVRVVSSPDEAFRAVASGELADDVALVGAEVAHGGAGAARLVEATADRVVLEVEGDGGVVGLLRGFHPLWRARLEGGEAIPTARVDLVLLGVVVPPGRHRVELATTPAPLGSAAVAALALLGATAAFVLAGRRERGRA